MANFANDADLLAVEPGVFVELPLAEQLRLRVGDAAVNGGTVTSATGGFDALEVGQVVTLRSGAAHASSYAIEQIIDGHTLDLAHAATKFDGLSDLALSVYTFRPQMDQVHAQLMLALGIDTDDTAEALGESAIVSVGQVKRLEVLGTLERAYRAGIAAGGENDALESKARRYALRWARSLEAARVLIDTDGDGRADVWRAPTVGRLVRN